MYLTATVLTLAHTLSQLPTAGQPATNCTYIIEMSVFRIRLSLSRAHCTRSPSSPPSFPSVSQPARVCHSFCPMGFLYFVVIPVDVTATTDLVTVAVAANVLSALLLLFLAFNSLKRNGGYRQCSGAYMGKGIFICYVPLSFCNRSNSNRDKCGHVQCLAFGLISFIRYHTQESTVRSAHEHTSNETIYFIRQFCFPRSSASIFIFLCSGCSNANATSSIVVFIIAREEKDGGAEEEEKEFRKLRL